MLVSPVAIAGASVPRRDGHLTRSIPPMSEHEAQKLRRRGRGRVYARELHLNWEAAAKSNRFMNQSNKRIINQTSSISTPFWLRGCAHGGWAFKLAASGAVGGVFFHFDVLATTSTFSPRLLHVVLFQRMVRKSAISPRLRHAGHDFRADESCAMKTAASRDCLPTTHLHGLII